MLRTKEKGGTPVLGCYGLRHLPVELLREILFEGLREETRPCKGCRVLCRAARERASQDLTPALPGSPPAAHLGLPFRMLPSSLPPCPELWGKSLSSSSFTHVTGSSHLPVPPTPKQEEKKNPLFPPCLPPTPQSPCFLSLSSKAAARGCPRSAVSAVPTPTSLHTPLASASTSPLLKVYKFLSSQNVLLNSLTFENVQC